VDRPRSEKCGKSFPRRKRCSRYPMPLRAAFIHVLVSKISCVLYSTSVLHKTQRSEIRLPRTWNSFFTECSIFHLTHFLDRRTFICDSNHFSLVSVLHYHYQPSRFARNFSMSNRGKRKTFPSNPLFFFFVCFTHIEYHWVPECVTECYFELISTLTGALPLAT